MLIEATVSIVLPSYNEPKAFKTLELTRKLFPDAQIIISPDNEGRGKGWAVRKGILASKGDIIVIMDADGDIHPDMINRLLPYISHNDAVIGIKNVKKLPLIRSIVSLGYRVLVKLLFRLNISDTQTGLKIWKRESIPIFETHGFAYDLEMLIHARKMNLLIKEIPIDVKIEKRVKLVTIWNTFVETVKLWRKLCAH